MTREESWQELLGRQSESGLSISEWCKREGIRDNRFYYWRKRLGGEVSKPAGGNFVRLDQPESLELLVGNSVRIKIPSNFDRGSLKSLLELLGC